MVETSFARMLIAETDENGDVAFVWVKAGRSEPPHPVRNARRWIDRLPSLEIAGASRDAVSDWLAPRAGAH